MYDNKNMNSIDIFDNGSCYIIDSGNLYPMAYGSFLLALTLIDIEELERGKLCFQLNQNELQEAQTIISFFMKREDIPNQFLHICNKKQIKVVEKLLLGGKLSEQETETLMPDSVEIRYRRDRKTKYCIMAFSINTLEELVFLEVSNIVSLRSGKIPRYGKCEICGRLFMQAGGKGNLRKYCDYQNPDGIACSQIGRENKIIVKKKGMTEQERFAKSIRERLRKQQDRNHWPALMTQELDQKVAELMERYNDATDFESYKKELLGWYDERRAMYKKK